MHLFPFFLLSPPPPASCQLLCVEIYIMRVEYRNLSVSTIKHNDVIRALKQKSYHIVLAQLFEAPKNAIQRINRYLADKRQRIALCYASDRDLSNGYRYPPFDQPRSARLPWGHLFFSCGYLNEGIFPYSVSELSAGQVDVLWDCLVCDSESSDDTLEWFLQQAQSKEFHALDVSALQYILAEKVTPLI